MSVEDTSCLSVVMVSTPDDGSCGVGSYTDSLRQVLSGTVDLQQVLLASDAHEATHFLKVAFRAGTADADLVHVQHEYGLFGSRTVYSWLFFPLLWLLTTLRGTPLIVTVHEAWSAKTIESGPYVLKRAYVHLVNKLLVSVADELIFLSDIVADEFISTVSVPSAQIFPHGVWFDREYDGTTEAARHELDIDPEATLVVEPGYVSEAKGCDRLVTLADRFSQYEFLLAGGTRSERDDSFMMSIRERAPDNVTITGVLPNRLFHAAFIAADVIVLPYRKDGQSGIVNWCATYEMPTVGSECGYFRSLATEYGCIDLIDASNEDALAAGVSTLVSDEDRQATLSRAMRRYKSQNGFDAVATRHVSLYRELTTDGRGTHEATS